MNKHWIVIVAGIIGILIAFTCTVERDHPLDVHGENYIPPEIVIDTDQSTILPDDTIHFDSGTIVLSDGEYPSQFRYKLTDADWREVEWQSDRRIHLEGLEEGATTVTVQTRYEKGKDIVEEEFTFVVLTYGYKPTFADTSDSTMIITPGDSLEMTVIPTGKEPLMFQWFKGDSALDDATDSVLVLKELPIADTGSYFCRVVNEYGTAESRRFILVHELRYSVTYDPNGADSGNVPVDDSLYREGEEVVGRTNSGELFRDGFTFAGWLSALGDTGKKYAPGARIPMGNDDMLLYAWWTDEPMHTVVYHVIGVYSGKVPLDSNEYVAGSFVTVLDTTGNLEKTDSVLIGWSRDSSGSGKLYAAEDTVMIGNSDLALYAKWRAVVRYPLVYSANGADEGDVPEDTTWHLFGETVLVKGNSGDLARAGFTYTGWNTDKDGNGTDYTENDSLKIDGGVTLYAQWTDKPVYRVIYDENGAENGNPPVDSKQYQEGDTVSVASNTGGLTIAGSTFTGWSTVPDGNSGTSYTPGALFVMGADDITLYARWTDNPTYTITYTGNGSTGGTVPAEVSNEAGVKVAVAAQGTMVRKGYRFTGWNTYSDGSGTDYAPNDTFTITAKNDTLFAKWEINLYTVAYDGNGNGDDVTGVPQSTTHRYNTEMTLDTSIPQRNGFTFFRWNTSSEGDGEDYQPGAPYILGDDDVTLYAKWNRNRYVITYNGNGNTGGTEPDDDTIFYRDSVVISGNGTLVKTGYSFVAWNTEDDGSGTGYPSDTTILVGAGDLGLFAQWEKNSYHLSYNANEATSGTVPDAEEIPYGDSVTVAGPGNLAREGWSFTGWNTKADGSGAARTPGSKFAMETAPVTLFAQWVILDYSITYHLNGGTNGSNPSSFTVETATITLAAATKTSFTFGGWYDNENLSGEETSSIPTGSTGDREFWARWIVIDVDGNEYTTVTIGNQVWMAENLKTTHYRDGTPIPRVTGDAAWSALTSPGYCWYDNDSAAYNEDYGVLYNWYTIADRNSHLLAPEGWRMPTNEDWEELVAYLGGADVAGGKLKEAGTGHWVTPNTGATNESGFSGLAGGIRFINGTFDFMGDDGGWWTEGEHDSASALASGLHYNHAQAITSYVESKKVGNSVRCIPGERTHFNVTFNSQGGTVVTSQSIHTGDPVTVPTEPTRDGYFFAGWFKEPECTNEWNFGADVVTGPVVLFAKWLQGPCDIYEEYGTSCVAAYSTVRLLSSGYSGPLYQVRRTSDNATQDIAVLPSGFADAAQQDAFLDGEEGTISILYDQSGMGNDLTVAKKGCYEGTASEDDYESNANGRSLMVGGHRVYALYMSEHDGYRSNQAGYAGYPDRVEPANGMPTGSQAQGIYAVMDGKRIGDACCWNFGNGSTNNCYGPTGLMNTLFFGTAYWGRGADDGPWFMNDMEAGVWAGGYRDGDPGWGGLGGTYTPNENCPSMTMDYAFGVSKTSTVNDTPYYCLRMANAQEGATPVPDLVTAYDGRAPATWKMEGSIILGIGSDNSNTSFGTFFEGCITAGRPSDAADAAVLENIRAIGYGSDGN